MEIWGEKREENREMISLTSELHTRKRERCGKKLVFMTWGIFEEK